MVNPICGDNSDRRIVPIDNYVPSGLNVLVFVVFQGMGSNDKLVYKMATVPPTKTCDHLPAGRFKTLHPEILIVARPEK